MYSPKLEEFQKLAAQGNLIPVTRRLLADIETPLSAYRKIRGAGESFLFESVEGGEHIGRYSFVGCNPRALIRQTGNRVEVIENGKTIETFTVTSSRRGNEADAPKARVVRFVTSAAAQRSESSAPISFPKNQRHSNGRCSGRSRTGWD